MNRLFACLLGVFLFPLQASGCAHFTSKVQPTSERICQRVDGPLSHPSKIPVYAAETKAQHYDKALAAIREEVASPGAPGNEGYLVVMYTSAIQALTNFARDAGATPELDAEATRYHDAEAKLCLEDLERGKLANAMAIYYSRTRRNGLALKWLYDEREIWAGGHDEQRRIVTTESLANIYDEMGQAEMRDKTRTEALADAKKYWRAPDDPAAPQAPDSWLAYMHILQSKMADLSHAKNAAELLATWNQVRAIVDKYVTPKSPTYSLAAVRFALVGDSARADQLIKQAAALAQKERTKIPRTAADVVCQEGLVLVAEKKFANAMPYFDKCQEMRGVLKLSEDDPAVHAGRALAEESTGRLDDAVRDYDAAIHVFEAVRGNYELGARGTLFANPTIQKSYFGKLRVLVRRAEDDPSSVLAALRAADDLRARQFGDTLAAKGQRMQPLDDLALVHARLGPDDAIVSYTLMDTSFALIVVTSDRAAARLVEYDPAALAAHVKAARAGLTRPDGNPNAELDAIAALVAMPAAALIGSKRHRLIVLPDGPINTIPYELLAARGMGTEMTVTLTPSIAYFVAAPTSATNSNKTFFGLGDPTYPSALHVAGIPDTAIGHVVIPRLPETRQEVTAIAAQLGSGSKLVLGADATPRAVKTQDFSRFRFLHFATHGVLGGEVPGIDEPSLVLAGDEKGDPFLRASEAATLKLDADLTVLSACNTGSGKFVTGEGVLGMSRAFLLAGSRAVVMSLWAVDSEATERLMTLFYENLARGKTAPVALRQAKLALQGIKHDASYDDRGLVLNGAPPPPIHQDAQAMAHPYFWSAFVLVGGADAPR